MIFLIYGSDKKRSHDSLKKMMASFLSSKNPPSLYRIDEESFSLEVFNSFVKTGNFFSERNLVVAKRLLQNSQAAEYIHTNLEALSSSFNIFMFLEESINPALLKEIKKYGEVKKFDLPDKGVFRKDKESAGLFKVADLAALRKKDEAWLFYQKLIAEGIPEEEIFWKIFWQFNVLALVKKKGGKKLHPFVLSKAKKAAVLFKESELGSLLGELADIYHNYRSGTADLGVGLERFILRIL